MEMQSYENCPQGDEQLFLDRCLVDAASTTLPIPILRVNNFPAISHIAEATYKSFATLPAFSQVAGEQ